jgi:hypothetical protein
VLDSYSLAEVEDGSERLNKVGMVDYNIRWGCIERVLNSMRGFRKVPNQEFAVHILTGIRRVVLNGFSFQG